MDLTEQIDTVFKIKPEGFGIIFSGPYGIGKRTQSERIAKELGYTICDSPDIVIADKLIVRIDDAQDLNRTDQKRLLYQLQEGCCYGFDYSSGKTIMQRVYPIYLLLTTNIEKLSEPIRNHCLVINFEIYAEEIISEILKSKYKLLEKDRNFIAKICFGKIHQADLIAQMTLKTDLQTTLRILGLDEYGLDINARQFIVTISKGSKSIKTIASILNIDETTCLYVEEKLKRLQMINIDSKGRNITTFGKKYFDYIISQDEI